MSKIYWRHVFPGSSIGYSKYGRGDFDAWVGAWGNCKLEGGYTLRIDPDNRTISIAVCSTHDKFSRRKGREVAEQRVRENLLTTEGNYWLVLAPRMRGNRRVRGYITEAIKEAVEVALAKYDATTVFVDRVSLTKPKTTPK